MEIVLDCVPCMLKQALEASRMVTDDIQKQDNVIEETMKMLLNYKLYRNAPDLGREVHHIVKIQTGIQDPYYAIKEKDLKAAKKVYPYLSKIIKNKKDSLYWALKISATGNSIDAAIYSSFNIEECIENELKKEFLICDIEMLKKKLETAINILIIGDNTGETVFDKVMIENLTGYNVTYGVRSEPIINDATEKEAFDSGLGEVCKVVSTGCNAPGVILEDCSDEFIDIYNKAHIIISKGQGNFEALSEEKGNIFFLLKAKCPMIARKLNVNLNEYVFMYSGINE